MIPIDMRVILGWWLKATYGFDRVPMEVTSSPWRIPYVPGPGCGGHEETVHLSAKAQLRILGRDYVVRIGRSLQTDYILFRWEPKHES